MNATAPVLFQSTDTAAVFADPANAGWVAVLRQLDGSAWELVARLYYAALNHMRRQVRRVQALDRPLEIVANDLGQAREVLLEEVFTKRPKDLALFAPVDPVEPMVFEREPLPRCLLDPLIPPPSLMRLLVGPGRPPTDFLCLLRATLGSIAMGLSDSPSAVNSLLASNPTFSAACGFLGRGAHKEAGALTSLARPAESTLAQFDAVMTRYGLWHKVATMQVLANIESGALQLDDVLAFDTTHSVAASGCSSIRPEPTEKNPKPKSRKISRMQKSCDCGKEAWGSCPHPWLQTDPGAAVVVKGPSRIYWAHKLSFASTGSIPISIRACSYAAMPDGKTLPVHLDELAIELPEAVRRASTVLGDAVYGSKENKTAAKKHGLKLIAGITGRKAPASLALRYPGIDRFTPNGVPICSAEHAFDFRGRDIQHERFIWQAPADEQGTPTCSGCALAPTCLISGGKRRHLRVHRAEFPQIDWDLPQHQALHKATYAHRTGVERAIKRVKKDYGGEHLSRRGASRVQAHYDRRLLVIHLLLAAANTS